MSVLLTDLMTLNAVLRAENYDRIGLEWKKLRGCVKVLEKSLTLFPKKSGRPASVCMLSFIVPRVYS